jgi:osmotically-inducible protein OsmY
MKVVFASALVAVALVAVPSPVRAAAPQSSAVKPSDKTLDERIEKRLTASTLKRYDIDVNVDMGVAKLTGTVATEADRRRATQLATIPGIARVENQLVVNLAATKGTSGTMKSTAKEGAEKTKEGAEKVVDKTKEGLSKTGEVITDAWITTRVKSKFVGEDLLKDSDINVDTDNHIVTLRGTVMSAAGRARAVAQAKEVEGVHQVLDRLTIAPKK